jgi:aryl-alcohol dehydrogenase-like predicted oxidoreductase
LGEFSYDPSKRRESVPFIEQLKAFQEIIQEAKVRYIGVSNETSYEVWSLLMLQSWKVYQRSSVYKTVTVC